MNTVVELPFLSKYKNQAIEYISTMVKRPLRESELARLDNLIKERFKNVEAVIHNPTKDVMVKTTLGNLAGWVQDRSDGAIMTGHGTIFRPHNEYNSIVGGMVDFLLKQRKVLKNKMFELMHAGRPPEDSEVKALDVGQKLFKLLANSFYGAYGEKGFHFYNPALGPAVTMTGQLIISATMFGFESFLSGNLWLRNADEMARHIAICLKSAGNSKISEEWGEHPALYDNITEEDVVQALCNSCSNTWKPEETARILLKGLTKDDLVNIYLRGNPHLFLTFPDAYECLQIAINGNIREADPDKLEQHHPEGKKALDRLAEGMKKWVAVHWTPVDLNQIVTKMIRRSVLIVDTDSNFLNLHPWMEWLDDNVEGFSNADEDKRLTGLNIMVYCLRLMSDFHMEELTKNLGVPEDKRKIINFKSEFVIKRLVMTEGKKHYAALVNWVALNLFNCWNPLRAYLPVIRWISGMIGQSAAKFSYKN